MGKQTDNEENRWLHYNEFVFYRNWFSLSYFCCSHLLDFCSSSSSSSSLTYIIGMQFLFSSMLLYLCLSVVNKQRKNTTSEKRDLTNILCCFLNLYIYIYLKKYTIVDINQIINWISQENFSYLFKLI